MRTLIFAGCLAGLLAAGPAVSEPLPRPDGAHDFDFNIGVWKTHIQRRAHPLAGSSQMIEMNGTVTVRKVWDGRAQLEEIEATGPNGPWRGMTLFLYNPQARQWSQTYGGLSGGGLSSTIGSFRGGRGELYASDTFDGRAVLVRGVWSDITPNAHKYEESYSEDGGRTWEAEFSATLTRLADAAPEPKATAFADGSHAFDFDLGAWRTKTSRLVHPLSGSTEWTEMDGTTVVKPLWDGRGNIAEFESDGPNGHLELLSLRLFDPAARQWSLNFATSSVGVRSVPMVGEFKDGRGVFYDQEAINGRTILVRFSMIPISANEARSEQAFSADGGQTWETNWINRYTRIDR